MPIVDRIHSLRSLLAVVASVAAIGGCKDGSNAGAGGGDGGVPSSATPAAAQKNGGHGAGADPCGTVTEKDATAAFGSDPGPGQATVTAAGTGRCTYSSGANTLLVTVTPNQTKAAFDHAHDLAAKDAHPGTFAEVSEVGHSAFSTFGGPMASIQFYKGTTAVYIMLTLGGHPAPPRSQVTALAVAAAGRV